MKSQAGPEVEEKAKEITVTIRASRIMWAISRGDFIESSQGKTLIDRFQNQFIWLVKGDTLKV